MDQNRAQLSSLTRPSIVVEPNFIAYSLKNHLEFGRMLPLIKGQVGKVNWMRAMGLLGELKHGYL